MGVWWRVEVVTLLEAGVLACEKRGAYFAVARCHDILLEVRHGHVDHSPAHRGSHAQQRQKQPHLLTQRAVNAPNHRA